jgi:hypothetical protein
MTVKALRYSLRKFAPSSVFIALAVAVLSPVSIYVIKSAACSLPAAIYWGILIFVIQNRYVTAKPVSISFLEEMINIVFQLKHAIQRFGDHIQGGLYPIIC